MSIEARLYTALTGHVGLAALISTRVYPVQLPQSPTLPAVTYLRISTAPVQHRDNPTPTYSKCRFQLDGWAADFDAAIALRGQIRLAMGAWIKASAPRVDGARLRGDRDALEAEPGRWLCQLDYMVDFQED